MAVASIGLRPTIDRRTQATHSLRSAPALSGSPRSSSVPAAARQERDLDTILPLHGFGNDGTATTLPAGLALPTTNTRTAARSLSPARLGTHLERVERRFLARAADNRNARQADVEQADISTESSISPLVPKAPPTTPTATVRQRAEDDIKTRRAGAQDGTDISDDSLGGGQSGQAPSARASRSNPGKKMEDMGLFTERAKAPSSGLGMPGKLMELIEDRDRAVQLCLQVCQGHHSIGRWWCYSVACSGV